MVAHLTICPIRSLRLVPLFDCFCCRLEADGTESQTIWRFYDLIFRILQNFTCPFFPQRFLRGFTGSISNQWTIPGFSRVSDVGADKRSSPDSSNSSALIEQKGICEAFSRRSNPPGVPWGSWSRGEQRFRDLESISRPDVRTTTRPDIVLLVCL